MFKALLVPRFDDEGTGMLQDSVLASALRHCHCGPSHTAVFGKPRCSGPKVRQLRLRGGNRPSADTSVILGAIFPSLASERS